MRLKILQYVEINLHVLDWTVMDSPVQYKLGIISACHKNPNLVIQCKH